MFGKLLELRTPRRKRVMCGTPQYLKLSCSSVFVGVSTAHIGYIPEYCAPFRLGAWNCRTWTSVLIWRSPFCLPLCSLFPFSFRRQWNGRKRSKSSAISSSLSSRDSSIGCLTSTKHRVFLPCSHPNLSMLKMTMWLHTIRLIQKQRQIALGNWTSE